MTSYQDLIESRRRRMQRWASVSLAVALVHVGGGALAIYHWPEEPTSADPSGAFVVEMAPVVAAPRMERLNMAIGPRSVESPPTVTPTQEVLKASQVETVDLDPAPLAPDPEVVLPKPQPLDEIDEVEAEEQPQPEQLAQVQSTSASLLDAAPPPIEAQVAEKATAPSVGLSNKHSQAELNWHKSLVRHINRHKKYPRAARREGKEGSAGVAFTLDRSGKVLSAKLTNSSGSTDLDAEAVAVLERASPFPAPPADVARASISLRLPIKFQIKNRR